MDESIVKHLEQQQITKLSQAIRRGHEMIGEDHRGFLACGSGCAIGAAWVGSGRAAADFYKTFYRGDDGPRQIADELGISVELFNDVSFKHYEGMPRLAIAEWLETMGY